MTCCAQPGIYILHVLHATDKIIENWCKRTKIQYIVNKTIILNDT